MKIESNNDALVMTYGRIRDNTSKPKRKYKILKITAVVFILFATFLTIEYKNSENDNNLVGYVGTYAEMIYPDYSGNGGGTGMYGGSNFVLEIELHSGSVSIQGKRYFLTNQLNFTKPSPERRFYYGSFDIVDPGFFAKVQDSKTSSLDITFEMFKSIEETRALATQYDVDIIWMPLYDSEIQLGISDQPKKSDADIRMRFLLLIQNEKFVTGHNDFKNAINYIFRNDFRIFGFRVEGRFENMLKLLEDLDVKTFRIYKSNDVVYK